MAPWLSNARPHAGVTDGLLNADRIYVFTEYLARLERCVIRQGTWKARASVRVYNEIILLKTENGSECTGVLISP